MAQVIQASAGPVNGGFAAGNPAHDVGEDDGGCSNHSGQCARIHDCRGPGMPGKIIRANPERTMWREP